MSNVQHINGDHVTHAKYKTKYNTNAAQSSQKKLVHEIELSVAHLGKHQIITMFLRIDHYYNHY